MSASFARSFSFFSRLRGVALAPAAAAVFCRLAAAALGAGWDRSPLSRMLGDALSGRSVCEEPGDTLGGLLGAGTPGWWAAAWADCWPGAGERLSRVVLARASCSAGLGGLVCGRRWEVDRSRAGVAGAGGGGAMRWDTGWGWLGPACFLGGIGAAR